MPEFTMPIASPEITAESPASSPSAQQGLGYPDPLAARGTTHWSSVSRRISEATTATLAAGTSAE